VTIDLEGNVLIVVCIECGRFEWFTEWDAMVVAGWHDDDAERISCPEHGPTWAEGYVVGSITDEAALRESLERCLAAKKERRDEEFASFQRATRRLLARHYGVPTLPPGGTQ
jgi:hypothetical protein